MSHSHAIFFQCVHEHDNYTFGVSIYVINMKNRYQNITASFTSSKIVFNLSSMRLSAFVFITFELIVNREKYKKKDVQ